MDKSALSNITQRLKVARIAGGFLRAKDFANHATVSLSTYSQHETGKRCINIESLLLYSKLLKVNPGWLLTGEGSPIDSSLSDKFREKIILKEIKKLEEEGKIEATVSPMLEGDRVISIVELSLFKSILVNILPILEDNELSKNPEHVIDFSFDLYNKIVTCNADLDTRKIIITLCIESFFQGLNKKKVEEFVEKVVSLG